MGRKKADRAYPPPAQSGQPQIPQNVPQHTGHAPVATEPYQLSHGSQTRQGDSWRSYRNDAVPLQPSSKPQTYQPAHDPRVYGFGSKPSYQPAPQYMIPEASSFQHSQGQFAPYQPLRSSDGTRERQILQQARNTSDQIVLQTNVRYPFRHRRVDQIAPYSTRALADIPLPSIEGESSSPLSTASHTVPARKVASRRSRTRTSTPENVESPPPPAAGAKYLRKAGLPPARRTTPQKLLVVLDLNGTLLVRPNRRKDPTKFKIRPGVTQLLDYLFENHVVMVYSSARPENATLMVANLIHPKQRQLMAGVWARDKLDLNKAQYNSKVQVYKRLHKIWADPTIQAKAEPGRKWDQSNTILVDDSQLKALAQPHNLLQVPEFEDNAPREGGAALRDWQLKEQEILNSLQQKLEELKWQVDVSRLIREWQTGKQHALGVVDETIDQKTYRSLQHPEQQQQNQQQLEPPSPTPSVGQQDTRQHRWPSLSQSAGPEPTAAELEASPGGGASVQGKSALDVLEEEIDRTIHRENIALDNGRRSESPIDENVWKEILSGGSNQRGDEQKGKRSCGDVPATPESMGA